VSRPVDPESLVSKILRRLLHGPCGVDGMAEVVGFERTQVHDSMQRLRRQGMVERAGRLPRVAGTRGPLKLLYALTYAGRGRAQAVTSDVPSYSRRSVVIKDAVAAETLRRAQDKGRARHANAGLAARVRAALAETPGQSLAELALGLDVELEPVRKTMHALTRFGGVVFRGPRLARRYFLFGEEVVAPKRADPARPFRIAAPVSIGRGARWGVEHW